MATAATAVDSGNSDGAGGGNNSSGAAATAVDGGNSGGASGGNSSSDSGDSG